MSYASSHRKGVSFKVWQTRQYYLQMLYDAIDTYPPDPELGPRDNSANAIIHGIKLVKAAIDADDPTKEPSPCPEVSPNPPKPTQPPSAAGASTTSEDSTLSAEDLTKTLHPGLAL